VKILQKVLGGLLFLTHTVYTLFRSACTMSSVRKFTFADSSPDEFLVSFAEIF